MRRTLSLGLLALALLIAGVRPALADEPTQPYVVIVGVNQYADAQIIPRTHAEADAKALYDLLIHKDHLAVDAEHIKLLLGAPDKDRPSEFATRENVLKAVGWMAKNAKKDQLTIFAFFGQGAPLGERACYFATDSTFKDRAKNAIASGDIEHEMEKLKAQNLVAFLDVNFLGFKTEKGEKPDPVLGNYYREFFGKEEEAKGLAPSRVVFLANSGIKPSLEVKDHGLFAKVLLDGLRGKADVGGYEPDGTVTVAELVKYVKKEMPEQVRSSTKTDDEKGLMPVVFDFYVGDFSVNLNPTAYPKAKERLTKFQELAKKRQLSRELTEEGVNLLSRMPQLEAQQKLRKAFQKLVDGDLSQAAFQAERDEIMALTMLPERDANNYAIMIMRAVRLVRQGFVKDVNQGQLVDSAVRGLYRHLNEKLPSSISERLDDVKTMKESELLRLLTDARSHLGKREDLAGGKDVTNSLHPMLGKLDKHTDYVDPEQLVRMQQQIQGHFTGIGVQIRKNNIKDYLQVVTPIVNSPAYKAGVQTGDLITGIVREVDSDGKPLPKTEVLTTKGMSTEDAVKKILGTEGTKIKIVIERDGKPMEFNLIRGRVETESVAGLKRNADDSWDYVVDPENKICYVRLMDFSNNTHRDLERVMKRLAKEGGIRGFILDLRFNPGGLLDQAVKISDLFIDDGLIVTIRPRNGPETSYVGRSEGSYLTFPMVCLVNGHSASASEIVSAALQDHRRAIIVGTRSYGKGSVQTIHPFDTGGRLKLTTATFWRPSNRNLNRLSSHREEDEWGVTPDPGFALKLGTKELYDLQDWQREHEIIRRAKPSTENRADFRDRQLDMAVDYLRQQIRMADRGNGARKAG